MNCALKAYEQEAQRAPLIDRDELIITHLPLVKFLVGRIASQLPPHLDREDLMSAAVIGLITAAERFDPTRGVQFKTFVEQRIRGTIMDELRSQDWLTRSLREKFKRLEHEFSILEQKLGRNPTSEEVSSAMGMNLENISISWRKSISSPSSASTTPGRMRTAVPSVCWTSLKIRGWRIPRSS